MAFIGSDNILIFPSAKRNPTHDSTSRLTTEYNLVNIVNRLICNDKEGQGNGFVITTKIDTDNKVLEFSLGGYYFRINEYTDLTGLPGLANATNIWAAVSISGDVTAFDELQPLNNSGNPITSSVEYPLDNSNNEFIGVNFLATEPASSATYLHILTKYNNAWTIPEASKIRYILKSPMGLATSSKGVVTLKIDDGDLGDNCTNSEEAIKKI